MLSELTTQFINIFSEKIRLGISRESSEIPNLIFSEKKKINKSSAAVVISILRVEHTRINPFTPEIQKCILTLNLGESIVSNRDVGNK